MQIGNLREIRPNLPVENMLLQDCQRFNRRMDQQRFVAHKTDAINQQGQAGNMIQMRVRDEHMVDDAHLGQAEIPQSGSGIDQHIMIDQQRSGAEVATYPPTTSKHAQFHRPSAHFVLNVNTPSQFSPGGLLR